MKIEELRGKKVAVLGLGTEGLSTARFLIRHEARDITLLDKSEKDLPSEVVSQTKQVFGSDYLKKLDNFDVVFRSPGINPNSPEIVEAKQKGVVFTSQTQFFLEEHSLQTIGITGTKGKGTTSSLIFEIFKTGGKKVFLGGNIGTAPLDFFDRVDEKSVVILELSSFQLSDTTVSPHVAIVLMVTSEHLDWHKDKQDYVKAKGNITRFQNEDDLVIANSDFESANEIANLSPGQKYFYSTTFSIENGSFVEGRKLSINTSGSEAEFDLGNLKLPGLHNLQNVSAAAITAFLEGIDSEVIQENLNSFAGLPDRLEFVREVDGVSYFSDSASTTPETATAAINSFAQPKIIILGGSSKKSDFSLLGEAVLEGNVRSVILIGPEATHIREAIEKAGKFSGDLVDGEDSIGKIVGQAKGLAKSGDAVILSPGCASFGMFENYFDRGNQFKEAVKAL